MICGKNRISCYYKVLYRTRKISYDHIECDVIGLQQLLYGKKHGEHVAQII